MRRALFRLGFAWLLLLGAGCVTAPPAAPSAWSGPHTIGRITSPLITEPSGLAASHRAPGVLWAHNDSGGQPVLYAITPAGRLLGRVRLAGATNVDWEDIAAFQLDGVAYLLVADTGDNEARRHDCRLYVIREPDPAELQPDCELTAVPAWTMPVRYPDGPRDCESVAVDAEERRVYLISKRTSPPVVYTLPLHPAPGDAPLARPVATLTGLRPASGPAALLPLPDGRYRAQPCALDISADGRRAVVLTYGEPYLYLRALGETWAAVFNRPGLRMPPHHLRQGEGACFSPDGRTLWLTSDQRDAPIMSYRLAGNP